MNKKLLMKKRYPKISSNGRNLAIPHGDINASFLKQNLIE